MKTVKFRNYDMYWDIAVDLHFPPDFNESKQYPAIISAHPIGSCKEQTSGNVYGQALAKAGSVVAALEAIAAQRTAEARGAEVKVDNLLAGWDAFHLAEVLLTQPMCIVVGDEPGAFGAHRDGCEIIERAASTEKEMVVAKGWSHYDLYDKPEPVKIALDKLIPFYKKHLG